jgi:predicted aldo/keto reductase-like oxidoreductase
MEQLVDNIRIFGDAKPESLTGLEKNLIGQVQTIYRDKIKVGCTGCNYCMPCPFGVSIPDVFRIYNQAFLYDDPAASRKQYQSLLSKQHDASQCQSCGQCEPQCPQNIPIIAKLAEAHAYLTQT